MKLNIEFDGRELFRFASHGEWVAKASSWFVRNNVDGRDVICVDSLGRVCRVGRHFARARDEGTFPVIVYKVD